MLSADQIWMIEQDVMRHGEEAWKFFQDRLAEGSSHRMAQALATQTFPGTSGTDRAFLQGRHNNQHMAEGHRQAYLDIAKQNGVVTTGKIHVSGLGHPSDPKSWVTGLDDVAAVCKERNYSAKGALNIEGEEVEFKRKQLSEDIVSENVDRIIQADPATAEKVRKNPKKLKELKERVIEEKTPHYKK